jgi:hypothetical protein
MRKKKEVEAKVEAPLEEQIQNNTNEIEENEVPVSWILEIGDAPQLFCKGVKFPVITPSAPSNGIFVFQILPMPGVSSLIHSWILKSDEKDIRLFLLGDDGLPVELWSMKGRPDAATWDDFEFAPEEPWGCSLQVSARLMTVSPVEATS